MGHLGHLKEEYRALLHHLDGGPVAMPEPSDPRAWEGWREILEILYTPEEAALAARLPLQPTSLERIAASLGVDPVALKPRLDPLCDRGLVVDLVDPKSGKVRYLLSPPVVGFFEFSMMRAHDDRIPQRRLAEALDAYTHGDEAFAREVFGEGTVIGRALVHESALGDDVPDVLDWERASAVVAEARSHAVAHCYCRHKAAHLGKACDAPQEVCLSLNAGADFVVRRRFGRAIERTEAMEMLEQARESGLVQIADNVRERPTYICNCCGCCCGQLQAINEFDLPAVNPSGFLAQSDDALCSGCSRCSRACPITAIAMTARRTEAKRKNELHPVVDEERCIGCGVCVGACRKGAMGMVRRARRPPVPQNAVERTVRRVIERGRLAELLFDEGGSRGSRFLHAVVRALTHLPGAERALASEQVRSRFVRAALARVHSPE